MYVWGGREVASGWYDSPEHEEYGADLYALDTVTNRWSIIPCSGMIPIGRRSHSACLYIEFSFLCFLCVLKEKIELDACSFDEVIVKETHLVCANDKFG